MARLHADTLTPMGSEVKTWWRGRLRGLKHNYNPVRRSVAGGKARGSARRWQRTAHAHFDQEIDGIPVFRRSIKIAMDRK